MDFTRNSNTKLHPQTQLLFPPNMEKNSNVSANPFAEDSLTSRINLKETTDFIKSLPISSNQSSSSSNEMVNERRPSFSSQKSIGEGRSNGQRRLMLMESPCTPGRGVFSFSSNVSGRRRNFPSKWIDAEKWVTSSGHDSPAHSLKNNQFDGFKHQVEVVYSEKSRVTEECFHGSVSLSPQDLILKDKLANEVPQILPSTEGFIFKDSDKFLRYEEAQVQHRDMGTEMTPIGSVTTSRCHTPFKSSSPARHNTPSQLSGPFTDTKNVIDISEFEDKLRLSGSSTSQYCYSVTSHWNSREEEEEEISKSLRHFDMESELRRSVSESKAPLWDDEDDKIKFCQRSELKILTMVKKKILMKL
jgi:hypothetical protein